eukprot:TRINITY_DN2511_c0_g2_i1.p1 TRINITY_DN2511_c0_g2~~TRINITY_DN2511_c0_g2_i1.p1  ORF type:complete len:694 (+),score=146.69 TRINITY_DN2511_c0_g2_i1:185-2266(+)
MAPAVTARHGTPPRRRLAAAKNGEATKSGKETTEEVHPLEKMVMQEATLSLPKAGRILGKLVVLYCCGFVLASSCCFPGYLVPVGVLVLAIATGWLQAIGEECKQHLFFPQGLLNTAGSILFRWQWTVLWAAVLFAFNLPQFDMVTRVQKVCVFAFVPLALMLLGQSSEPYRFKSARDDVTKAEAIVRQLVSQQDGSPRSDTPLVDSTKIPFYKLGSVAKLFSEFGKGCDESAKQALDLMQEADEQSQSSLFGKVIKTIYAPFRFLARELLLWESRDMVLYSVVALYFAVLYVGLPYLPAQTEICIFCVVLPFLGPKSKAGRHLRTLQEDIRLAQGAVAEKKGGCSADGLPEEWKTVYNWPMIIYLGGSHLAAFYAAAVILFFRGACPLFGRESPVMARTYALGLVTYAISGWGITAGAHRLWAHRSYKAGTPLKVFLMLANSIANQGSIYHWSRDHRVHHLYSDTIADPHDANRGFWFSHVGWLMYKKHPAVFEAGKKVNMDDLKADPFVMFQKRADPFWNLLWCFAMPAFMALYLGDTMWNGFLVAGVLRYCLVLNATWAVNSVVHAWGTKPYNASHLTTENGWVSIFAMGEGWHNWHHAFSWDYAAAEMGAQYQWNPTKVFIDVMAIFGLAWDRKRALGVWEQRKQRWEETTGRSIVESKEGPVFFKRRVVTFGPSYEDEDHDDACEAHN